MALVPGDDPEVWSSNPELDVATHWDQLRDDSNLVLEWCLCVRRSIARAEAPQLRTNGMKPMDEKHFEILRRHMVEVIGIHTDLLEEELGKAVLDKRIPTDERLLHAVARSKAAVPLSARLAHPLRAHASRTCCGNDCSKADIGVIPTLEALAHARRRAERSASMR